jgi:hypothetical protein
MLKVLDGRFAGDRLVWVHHREKKKFIGSSSEFIQYSLPTYKINTTLILGGWLREVEDAIFFKVHYLRRKNTSPRYLVLIDDDS